MSPERIAVVGTGYVGLTTGACLAHMGHTVVCADVDPEKIEKLQRGEVPILEAGLDELVREGLASERLAFTVGAAGAAEDCEFVFLCVQTPQGEDGSADLTYIRDAAAEIGPRLEAETIVINKSTVPVGSTRVVEQALGRDDIFVVSNPEFLREGSAVHDCLNPDRIVIGADDQAAAMRVAALFESLKAPLVITDPSSAETIKYASNAFLATKVSFVNALANVCEAVGADVREVVLGMGYDRRIGFEFLKPGPGWGGSCFHPGETVLVRRSGSIRHLSFAELFAAVDADGADGWEALSWRSGEPTPEFLGIATFTARPWSGELVELRTTAGRQVRVTPDHHVVLGDGERDGSRWIGLAGEVTTDDWVPVAQGFPVVFDDLDPALCRLDRSGDGQGDKERSTADLALIEALLGVVPFGSRPHDKNAAWVRVADIERVPHEGSVYSVEVPDSHTVVTTGGLVVGNCFPKDTRAMVRIAEDHGYDFNLLRGVISVNDEQYERMANKVERVVGGSIDGLVVAAWGLTFKARTDDMRDSPAIEVLHRLRARGAQTVRAYDPGLRGKVTSPLLEGIEVVDDPYAVCEGADVLVVLTEWDDFRWLDLAKVAGVMKAARIVDTRNLLEPAAVRRRGFTYDGLGRA